MFSWSVLYTKWKWYCILNINAHVDIGLFVFWQVNQRGDFDVFHYVFLNLFCLELCCQALLSVMYISIWHTQHHSGFKLALNVKKFATPVINKENMSFVYGMGKPHFRTSEALVITYQSSLLSLYDCCLVLRQNCWGQNVLGQSSVAFIYHINMAVVHRDWLKSLYNTKKACLNSQHFFN